MMQPPGMLEAIPEDGTMGDALIVITTNYATCVDTADRLQALQEFNR